MENDLTTTFFSTTYSIQQARSRIRLLRTHLLTYFFQGADTEKPSLTKTEDPWLSSLDETFYKQFSSQNVYQKIKELESTIASLKPLIIYLAFDIPEEEINKIGIWIRENLQSGVLFDIRTDQNRIGGCAFSRIAKYKDYSVRARIETKRDTVLSTLKSFS